MGAVINWIQRSLGDEVDSEGERYVFNGKGWQENKRINSSGDVVDNLGSIVTGFIRVKPGDVIRFKNAYVLQRNEASYNTFGYNDDYTVHTDCATFNPYILYAREDYMYSHYSSIEISDVGATYEALTKMTIPTTYPECYYRFTLELIDPATIPIITINQEIE